MKMKVLYHSKSGNTRKVAEAIAKEIGEREEAIPPAYPLENIGLLFIGGGIYAGKIDPKVKNFINILDSSRVKHAAVFGTSGGQDRGILEMKELLKQRGIEVLEESFVCKGKSFIFFNRKHPNAVDLQNAQNFARKAVEKLSKTI
ncbi:MAG: nitric oxide synthase [Clostridia bacterium]|nr:nitric oxide synthase [Clostridia bacterium]